MIVRSLMLIMEGSFDQKVKHFELKDTLRVAGGWVRDKLLGRESLDIDITTDTLSGSQLANRIGEYLKAHVKFLNVE